MLFRKRARVLWRSAAAVLLRAVHVRLGAVDDVVQLFDDVVDVVIFVVVRHVAAAGRVVPRRAIVFLLVLIRPEIGRLDADRRGGCHWGSGTQCRQLCLQVGAAFLHVALELAESLLFALQGLFNSLLISIRYYIGHKICT